MKSQRPKAPWWFTAGTHSVRARGDLGGLVLLRFAADLDQQVQQVVRAAAIVDTGDEVGGVLVFFAVQRVGNREAQVVVLDVAHDLGHLFQHLGQLLLPRIGVSDDVGDVALVGAGGIDRTRGVEVHIARGADRVVGAQDRP